MTPECPVCGYPALHPGGHAEWCERTAAWLRALPSPSEAAGRGVRCGAASKGGGVTAPTRRNRWRCAKCGAVWDRWAAAQRHSNDTGHGVVEIVWGEA